METHPLPIPENRPLTPEERRLARWMLEHGAPEAPAFLPHLERAHVVSRCPCGCASIDLAVEGMHVPRGGMRVLGDYVFGGEHDLAGVFIYECEGVLSGIEVYGLAGDTPRTLPAPEALAPLESAP